MVKGTTFVHVTHEATDKIGGIGAVLEGFFTSEIYLKNVARSILVGPLFTTEGPVQNRLGDDGEVLYSSIDGYINTGYSSAFKKIESVYETAIVYGRRTFVDPETGIKSQPEVLLVDVRYINESKINEFKEIMFEQFGIESNQYEHIWEYEQYVRLAPVAIAALKAIDTLHSETTIFAHEFMGMPTALAAIADPECNFKTVFHAHEVAPIRSIVEKNSGHDTMFYNAMQKGQAGHQYVDEVFGDQNHYFKHPLVKASRFCDTILAVGDYVAQELKFLGSEFDNININVVYNGIPSYHTEMGEKAASRQRLQTYCNNLLGYKPDYIFTHVTRLVQSKGLWRDLKILEHMETEFRTENKTGVMFLLSTEVAKRNPSEIQRMEQQYNWPVVHREGHCDLSGGEANFYEQIQLFNAKSRNIKIVFINQFGFTRKLCGNKMPEEMSFMDIRRGSDVEFGLSIYEPFGIAQLEPLTFGSICVVTNVCGCAGFVNDTTGNKTVKNVIIADYTDLSHSGFSQTQDPLTIDQYVREQTEATVSAKIAMQICSRLPNDMFDFEELVKTGYNLAKNMSWDQVVKKYLLPALKSSQSKIETVDQIPAKMIH